MKRLMLLAALAAFSSAAFAEPGNGNAFGLGNNGGKADATATALADADARATASNFTSVSTVQGQQQAQGQLQGQVATGGAGGNSTSYGSSASTGASTSSALAGGGVAYATMGNVTSTSAPSTSSATTGASNSTVGNVTATAGDATVGDVAASVGAVVEQGALQSSTNVTTNYKEAAQGVAIVLTTACGTAASGSGRSFSFGAAQGQDAFCKNLALAKVYFDLGKNDEGMYFVEAASKLVKVDNVFDQITTVLTLGILK